VTTNLRDEALQKEKKKSIEALKTKIILSSVNRMLNADASFIFPSLLRI
jgi:hypothetical protein